MNYGFCYFVLSGYFTSISIVPATISVSPIPLLAVSFSLNTIRENAIVPSILSLSIATTVAAEPSRRAL